MPQKLHDPQVKAQVCAALSAGEPINRTAERYGIPRTTVLNWKLRLDQKGASFLDSDAIRAQKEGAALDEFGRLLTTYVKESLETLVVQVRHSRDPAWLQQQDAGDLAVLHGVLADKILRVLEAAERASELYRGRALVERSFEEEPAVR